MDISLMLVIVNVAWFFVGSSNWASQQYSMKFRRYVSIALFIITILYFIFILGLRYS